MTPPHSHVWLAQPLDEWLVGNGNWKCSVCGEVRKEIGKPETKEEES